MSKSIQLNSKMLSKRCTLPVILLMGLASSLSMQVLSKPIGTDFETHPSNNKTVQSSTTKQPQSAPTVPNTTESNSTSSESLVTTSLEEDLINSTSNGTLTGDSNTTDHSSNNSTRTTNCSLPEIDFLPLWNSSSLFYNFFVFFTFDFSSDFQCPEDELLLGIAHAKIDPTKLTLNLEYNPVKERLNLGNKANWSEWSPWYYPTLPSRGWVGHKDVQPEMYYLFKLAIGLYSWRDKDGHLKKELENENLSEIEYSGTEVDPLPNVSIYKKNATANLILLKELRHYGVHLETVEEKKSYELMCYGTGSPLPVTRWEANTQDCTFDNKLQVAHCSPKQNVTLICRIFTPVFPREEKEDFDIQLLPYASSLAIQLIVIPATVQRSLSSTSTVLPSSTLLAPTEYTENSSESHLVTIVMAVVIALLLIMCTMVLVVGCVKFHKKPHLYYFRPWITGEHPDLPYKFNEEYYTFKYGLEGSANLQIIPRENINLVDVIGEGHFGTVYRGTATGLTEDEAGVVIAAKSLKLSTSDDNLKDFMQEARYMSPLSHPNIISLYGISLSKEPFFLVFEYMPEGDLRAFLQRNGGSLERRLMHLNRSKSRSSSSASYESPNLTLSQLMKICYQVACGMEHVASHGQIHRDLAARNCLVGNNLLVKIGDFGLSRLLYQKHFYQERNGAEVPVRWMAPEALLRGEFTIECDVWSFGVLMWEVFSFGLLPYYGKGNEEIPNLIMQGVTMEIPLNCPRSMYALMMSCWRLNSSQRPNFTELAVTLREYADHQEAQESALADNISYPSDFEQDDVFMEDEETNIHDRASSSSV